MIDQFRTIPARLIVRHLPGPRSLLIAAWGWFAVEAGDLDEKQWCIEVIGC